MPREQQDRQAEEPSPPIGRRQRRALAVHRALLDAGFSCFDRQPLAMVSVLDITEAADVSKGVFYLHFKSKDEFLIALWEDVKQTLLDSIRDAMSGARSLKTRIERAAAAYHRFATERSNATRFWIRMSGYLADEVGQPGQLTRIRQELVEQLAAMLGNVEPTAVTAELQRVSEVFDGCCWGVIAQAVKIEVELPEAGRFVHIIVKAAQAAKTAHSDAGP